MLRAALALLAERGIEAEVAWYEPYRMTPRLSVPSYRLGTRRPRAERREVDGAAAGWAIGAWLPELEFTHYRPTPLWRERIATADLHLVVSGTALAGLALERTATPFLAWIASDWEGDRRARGISSRCDGKQAACLEPGDVTALKHDESRGAGPGATGGFRPVEGPSPTSGGILLQWPR